MSADKVAVEVKKVCGIVMPISSLGDCSESHWAEVLAIICDAAAIAGFEGSIVSMADDVGIIQKRIIENLYENPIVVCDVSGKNSNVMFELGMRLAFDKPTIIIKDDKTSYSFDTSPIEHLEYPRDLRFSKIVDFKQKLADKIKATFERSTKDDSYTTFLKHFGEFKVAKIDKKEVTGEEYIIDELKSIRASLSRLDRQQVSNNLAAHFSTPLASEEDSAAGETYHFVFACKDHANLKKAVSFVREVSGATILETSYNVDTRNASILLRSPRNPKFMRSISETLKNRFGDSDSEIPQ